ncbi:hypothetical protein CHU95_05110 [Niveispirillum lacus]|uniref:DUF417 domain-containing protein n=1 Tax=Niveispirillum lacus TaxID=1981099 RepID=A0A255Z3S4_9PROT|nr:DUF417 family protein [Niveispirillum lacus]OYQ36173.1 hypothetical protein CHU95_05110 [Niveispirillum lacus]
MTIIDTALHRLPAPSAAIQALRWSMVFIFAMFGIAKFAAYEAEGVARIADHYWLFAWMYPLWGVQGASNAIGILELSAGALIAAGAWSHRAGLIGGIMGVATFLVTLSFAIGADLWQAGYGFPFMGSLAQFLFKDAVLLAACLALSLDAGHRLARTRKGAT